MKKFILALHHRKCILHLGVFVVLSAIVSWEMRIFIGNADESIELPQECLSQADGYKKWSCFIPYFEVITQRVSTAAAMAEAKSFEKRGVVSDCHLFSHVIGETSLEKYNFDMGQAFSSCIFGCGDGCFHGVMERYVRHEIDPHNVVSKVQNMCDSVGTDWRRKRQCSHGIGHGLIAHNFLPVQDALVVCKSLGSDWGGHCVGGLMMEYMDQYLNRHLRESDLKKALPNLCVPFESIGLSSKMNECLFQVSLALMYYTGHDVERSRELCEGLGNQDYIRTCKNEINTVVLQEKPSNIDIEQFREHLKVF